MRKQKREGAFSLNVDKKGRYSYVFSNMKGKNDQYVTLSLHMSGVVANIQEKKVDEFDKIDHAEQDDLERLKQKTMENLVKIRELKAKTHFGL